MFYKYFLSVTFLFNYLTVSSAEKNVLIKLNYYFFMYHALGFLSKNTSLTPRSLRFSSVFFQKFYSLAFFIRSIIHFELIIMQGIRSLSRFFYFFFSAYGHPFVLATFIKKTIYHFSIELSLSLCLYKTKQNKKSCICLSLFLSYLFGLIDLCLFF